MENLGKSLRIITVHFRELRVEEFSYLLSYARIDGYPTNEYIKLNNSHNPSQSEIRTSKENLFITLVKEINRNILCLLKV